MYCPRCGSQNTETIKFCRQCGLPLQQITSLVEAGGASSTRPSAVQPAQTPMPLPESSEMLALKQKRILAILAICIAPVVLAIIGAEVLRLGDIVGLPFLLVPLAIMWAVFHFRIKIRQLEEAQMREYYGRQQAVHPQSTSQPADLPPPQTNPFHAANPAGGSVIEDETRKLPIGNKSGQ